MPDRRSRSRGSVPGSFDHVREARAEYVVTRHGRPVARLVPVEPETPASPLGSMRGTLLRYDRPFDPVPAAWSLDHTDAE